ncbi:MAG: acyltransferase family protein [Acidimicrobiales bacterium]
MARLLPYCPPLDGVRGVAFLVVMATHMHPWPSTVAGQVAMDVFFGLSGFLITALLVGERATRGAISLLHFYQRRALRLLPALWLFLGVWLAVVVAFGSHGWTTTVPGRGHGTPEALSTALQGVGAALGYVYNWFKAYHLFGGYVPLGHLWSLAVEEQFYLLWAPLLALLLARRRAIALPATLLLAAVSLLAPLVLWHGGHGLGRIYFGTDTRAGALLLGAAAAQAWSRGWLDRPMRSRLGGPIVALAGVGLVLASFWMHDTGSVSRWIGGWVLASVAGPVVVVSLVERPRGITARVFASAVLRYVGRRSYALYLWHYVWITWLAGLGAAGLPLAVTASLASAEISWLLVERRALARKRRLAALPGALAQEPRAIHEQVAAAS